MNEHVVILCTAPDPDVGAALGRSLVEKRLAACVNVVGGVRSLYVWDGKVCDDREVQLVIKTRAVRGAEVRAVLEAEHPYDVPEILELPITGGSAAYLAWVDAQTSA